MRAANATRRTLQHGLAGLDERTASLALGLVIGDDRGQEDLDRFRFRASGLGHLLAVSGTNIWVTNQGSGTVSRIRP
jgi:predicted membrane metal-binding protein